MKERVVTKNSGKKQPFDPKLFPLVWGGALAVFILADLVFVMFPQGRDAWAVSIQAQQIRQNIENLQQNTRKRDQFFKQKDDLQRQVADLERMIYGRSDLPRVLQTISLRAIKTGVQIDQLQPLQDAQSLLCEYQGKKYYAVPVLIQAKSGFIKFEKFLGNLERERIFWQADSFSFLADPQYPQRNQIRFLIKIIVVDA